MKDIGPYSKRFLIWSLIGLLLTTVAMKFSNGAGFALIFLPALVGIGKNKVEILFYCLIATAMLTITNPYLAPKGVAFSFLARFVYLFVGGILFFQMVGQQKSKIVSPMLLFCLYLAYQALVSSAGFQPIISYLKLLLFTIIFFAFFSVANASTRKVMAEQNLRSVFLCFACFLIFGSICLIPFPGIGKMGAAQALEAGYSVESIGLFMGMTQQSQALGPITAIFSTVLFADLLWSIRRWDKLYVALLLCAPILIYYTSSRTAMGTYLAGMLFVGFVFMNARLKGRGAALWKTRALSVFFVAGMVACLGLFATPQARDAVVRFAFKSGDAEVEAEHQNFDSLVSSRQGLVDVSMANFRDSPVIGNGFQVSEEMKDRNYTSIMQVLSAPIEKGVWFIAVLEEGGVIGLLLFVIVLLSIFSLLLQRRAFIGVAAFLVLTVSNCGEFTFFSLSGMGGILWAVIFIGLALDAQRERPQPLGGPAFGMMYGPRPGMHPFYSTRPY